ncbi:hypothetical protein JXB41_05775 [Candidatus Woesearchaeota archaeon]|nr:hypothetical protein [Candidatus Woesearchaeota archaeon]
MKYLIEALIITVAAQFIYSFCVNLINKIPKVRIKPRKKYLSWKDYWLRIKINKA